MALVPDQKFSTFENGGDLEDGDIIVGLRDGINTRFTWAGAIGVESLTGTANQVLVDGTSGSPETGAIVLTLPQNIGTASTPTFGGLTLGSPLLGASGGTGVANTGLTINLSSGASNYVLTSDSSGNATWQAAGYLTGAVLLSPSGNQTITAHNLTLQTGSMFATVGGYASGSAAGGYSGTFQAFSTTAALGSISLIAANNGGNYSNTLTNASTAAARTWTLPDATGTIALTSQIPTGAALTKTDDTNVTLTLGGSPTTALVNAASLTLGWTGTLSGTRGGTGVNNGASTITLGGSLTTSGAFASTFTMTGITTVTFPTSGTLATTSQIPSGAALTKTDDTNVTLTLGGSPTTALVNAASLTLGWTGQLAISRGGTGISSFGTGVQTALGQNVTGSGGIVLATSPTLVTPILGTASATSLSFSSTSGIIGTTTNDSAAAGSVGQIISSVIEEGSALALTSTVIKNITTISLTAGDWDVWGNVCFDTGTATNIVNLFGWINTVSATFPDTAYLSSQQYSAGGLVTTGQTYGFCVPMIRISVAGTTTIYLSTNQVFSVSTLTGYGGIYARRRR